MGLLYSSFWVHPVPNGGLQVGKLAVHDEPAPWNEPYVAYITNWLIKSLKDIKISLFKKSHDKIQHLAAIINHR